MLSLSLFSFIISVETVKTNRSGQLIQAAHLEQSLQAANRPATAQGVSAAAAAKDCAKGCAN